MINKYLVGDVVQLTLPSDLQLRATLSDPQLFKIEKIDLATNWYLLRNMQTGQLAQPALSSHDLDIYYTKYGRTKYPY